MNYKKSRKKEISSMMIILIGSVVGFATLLVGGVISALMVEQGIVPEDSMQAIAVIIKMIATLTTTLVTWGISGKKSAIEVSVAVSIVLLLPMIVSLLLWGVDAGKFIISFITSIVVFGGCIWLLTRQKKSSRWPLSKKRYC